MSDDSVAKQVVATRLDIPGFHSPRLVLQAALLVRQGRPADAAEKLDRVDPEWRVRPEVRQLWGEVFYGLRRLDDAEGQFLSLLCEDPSRGDIHLWLGVIYYDQMQFGRFFREMERCVLLSPLDHRPHRLMGLSYHRHHRFSEAAHHFREALRLGGATNQSEIVSLLAQAQLFNRDYPSVVELIQGVSNPSGEQLAMLAEAHLNLGSGDEIINEFVERALKIGPHERRVLQFASQVYIDSGRAAEAIDYLNEILVTAPHYERAHYLLSRAYLKLGRTEDYEQSVKRLKFAEEIKKEHDQLMQKIVMRPNDTESLKRAEQLAEEMGEQDLAKLYAVARTSGGRQ